MKIKTFNYQLSTSKWIDRNFSKCGEMLSNMNEDLAYEFEYGSLRDKKIVDVKVNHYTVYRHNNGGYDEVWVQYTVLYY